jgi:hypothetical protein
MRLPGKLRLTTLGDVLGSVYREGATGLLELVETKGAAAGRVHRIAFAAGLVAHVESSVPTALLGEILRRRGAVGDAALERALERQVFDPDRRIGQLLVEEGAIPKDVLSGALRLQRKLKLERLFLLEDARLSFRVAQGGAGGAVEPLSPREFLHGRRRSRDRADVHDGGHWRRDPARSRALATLGLPESADRESVQRAFRTLARHLHPDRFPDASGPDRDDLMRRFAEITAAYHTLVA